MDFVENKDQEVYEIKSVEAEYKLTCKLTPYS